MTETIRVAAFDAYGTLFDVHSAARHLAPRLGDAQDRLSAVWRTKQLEYTWLRALMREYVDFWRVTTDALDYALSVMGLDDTELRGELLAMYERLDAYEEVPATLRALRDRGIRTAILSNGAPQMLRSATEHANLSDLLDAVLSVDVIGTFKPDPRVYQLAADHFDVDRSEVMFMTANAWDAAGAAAAGLAVVWVNRFGQPPERLPGHVRRTIGSLRDLVSSDAEKTSPLLP